MARGSHQLRRSACPTFYLGTYLPHWLASSTFPLFVSHKRLARYKRLPVARYRWALDSGAFSELAACGRWTLTPEAYVVAVRTHRDEIGRLDWAAPQDWMWEPFILAKTGLSVEEHQRRTVDNYLQLKALAPDLPFVPVLQGWDLADYLRCAALHEAAGVDLAAEPLVGVGSVCRRQATAQIGYLIEQLSARFALHGFGCKTQGLIRLFAAWACRCGGGGEGSLSRWFGGLSLADCVRWRPSWRAIWSRRDRFSVRSRVIWGRAVSSRWRSEPVLARCAASVAAGACWWRSWLMRSRSGPGGRASFGRRRLSARPRCS